MRFRGFLSLVISLSLSVSAAADSCPGLYFRLFSKKTYWGRNANAAVNRAASYVPGMKTVSKIYDGAIADKTQRDFFTKLIDQMQLKLRVSESDLAKIPKTGPTIIVSNHPYGIADGAAVSSVVSQVRPEVKVFMFDILAVEELKDQIFPIKLMGSKKERAAANQKTLAEAKKWLEDGHAVVIFPAGSVASYKRGTTTVIESEWKPGAVKMAKATNANIVPFFVGGKNSGIFHRLRSIHDGLGTAALPSQVENIVGAEIPVRIGDPVAPEVLKAQTDDAATKILRKHTMQLQVGWATVTTKGKMLQGKVEEISLTPDYRIWTIMDEHGNVHMIDDAEAAIVSESPVKKIALKKDHLKLAELDIDKARLKKAFCQGFREMRLKPEFKNWEALTKKIDPDLLNHKALAYGKSCINAQGFALGVNFIDMISSGVLRQSGVHNFWTDHESNLTVGLASMALFHNCLKGVIGSNTALTGVVTANLAANAYCEIDFTGGGQSCQRDGRPVKNDPADLAMGVSATIAYAAAVKAWEKRSPGWAAETYCK